MVMNHVSYFEAFYSLSLGFVHIGKKDAAQLLPFRKPSTFAQVVPAPQINTVLRSNVRRAAVTHLLPPSCPPTLSPLCFDCAVADYSSGA